MTLRDVARYLRPGTSLVLVVSVLIIPLWIWVATAHADHWFGGQRENIWSMTVRPWGGRLWSLTVVISISGWAAWYESMPPSEAHANGRSPRRCDTCAAARGSGCSTDMALACRSWRAFGR